MAKKIISRQSGELQVGQQAKFINTGKNGIQAETIQELNLTQHNIFYTIQVPAANPMDGDISTDIQIEVDPSHYNLIVIEENFSGHGVLSMPPELTLTKNISSRLKEKYARLTPSAVEKLKKYPTIIARINEGQAQAGTNQRALYGMITKIEKHSTSICVTFHYICTIGQQRLNEISDKMGLDSVTYSNELNHIHWTLKEINIIELLKKENIQVMIPSTL